MKYRPDIDGLRAVAVASLTLYHMARRLARIAPALIVVLTVTGLNG